MGERAEHCPRFARDTAEYGNSRSFSRYRFYSTMAQPPRSDKENLLNFTPAEAGVRLREFFAGIGEPAYRAAQVVRRLWLNPAPDFAAMTELPRALREQLEASFALPRLQMAARQQSTDG